MENQETVYPSLPVGCVSQGRSLCVSVRRSRVSSGVGNLGKDGFMATRSHSFVCCCLAAFTLPLTSVTEAVWPTKPKCLLSGPLPESVSASGRRVS